MTSDKPPPPVQQWIEVDPDTGDRFLRTSISNRGIFDNARRTAFDEMLRRISPPGRIAYLRAVAEAVPDDYPEKQPAIKALDLAEKVWAERMLWLERAMAILVNADRRYKARRKRFNGGKAAGAKRMSDAAEKWAPYQKRYEEYLTAGVPYLKAKARIESDMTKGVEKLPPVQPPSKQRMRQLFPKPENKRK